MLTLALLFIPAFFGLMMFLSSDLSKKLAWVGSLINAALAIGAAVAVSYGKTEMLEFDGGNIAPLGAHFALSINATSILMVLLNACLLPFIVHVASKHEMRNESAFLSLILFMSSAMMGAFLANDSFLFYICYEAALVPIYFIILQWSTAENKSKIVLKFFVYTLFASLFMLFSLLYVRQFADSFLISDMIAAGSKLSQHEQVWVFAGFFIAFAVKIPIFPFHTWQPNTYKAAPTAGTMLLAAVMLKMATYGLLRITMPMVPAGVADADWAMWLCVISIVYASFVALNQTSFKLLIAYSSIAHVGMIALGILANGNTAYEGALIEMVSHGAIAVGLFFIADMIESRVGHDHFNKLGGLREKHPAFAFLFFVIVMASVALPLTSGFVGEFLLLQSVGSHNIVMALLAGLTVVFGAVYMLRAFQSTMLGKHNAELAFADMTASEKWVLTVLVIITIAIGVYPGMLLDVVHKGLQLTGI